MTIVHCVEQRHLMLDIDFVARDAYCQSYGYCIITFPFPLIFIFAYHCHFAGLQECRRRAPGVWGSASFSFSCHLATASIYTANS